MTQLSNRIFNKKDLEKEARLISKQAGFIEIIE